MRRLLWLSLATISYVGAFWFPEMLWWCIFIYPIGIIVAGTQQGIRWYTGYIWGVITFTLHACGIYIGLYHLADGSVIPRMMPAILMSLYAGVYPAAIFGITTWIQQRYVTRHIYRVILWSGAIFVLTLLYTDVILIIFGVCEGYPLMHPIVPLATVPQLLSLAPVIGKTGYTLLLLATSGLIAYAIMAPSKRHAMWMVWALFIWLIPYYLHVEDNIEEAPISRITVIPILFPGTMSYDDMHDMLLNTLQRANEMYPDASTFIMPESAIYRSDADQFMPELSAAVNGKRLIYGAFTWSGDTCHTILSVTTPQGTDMHHKQHALPITERMPYICDYAWLRQQYYGDDPEVVAGTAPRRPVTLLEDQQCIPYICSELFLTAPPATSQQLPILFIGNDMWLSDTMSKYTADLMLLYATVNAITWQRPIWYVTYIHAYYISPSGEIQDLRVCV